MTESQSDHTELVNQIRNTLSHLYDVAYLQNHELALRLHGEGISDGVTRAQTLRRTLLDTLEALKPGLSDVPPEATRAYAILTYRYVDCLSIEEITERLNLSRRQVYREHAKGLKAMASLFLEQLPEQAPGAESESTATRTAERIGLLRPGQR